MRDRRTTQSDNMPRKQTATRNSGSLDALVIQRLLRKWRRKSKEFGKQVQPEWEHGNRYASRRYEGESIALRWCAEDLEAALYNKNVCIGDKLILALAQEIERLREKTPKCQSVKD